MNKKVFRVLMVMVTCCLPHLVSAQYLKEKLPPVLFEHLHLNVADKEATVSIPNSNGTFTAVKLTKHGKGYLGPQGEFYIGHPTVAQLKALYGD